MRPILLAVALLLSSTFSCAATYYVCSTGGLDGNDGLSTGAAWATITKANTAAGGSTVSFCGGGTWSGRLAPGGDSITYNVYNALSDFVGTATVSGNTLTVLSGSGGAIGIGSRITMSGLAACVGGTQCPTYVTGYGSGSGGTGTYQINAYASDISTATAITLTGKPPTITGSGADYALYVNARTATSITGLAFLNSGYTVASIETSFQAIGSGTFRSNVFGLTGSAATAKGVQFLTNTYNMFGVTFDQNLIFDQSYSSASQAQGMYFYHADKRFYNFTISQNAFYNVRGPGIQVVGSSMAVVDANVSYPYGFDIDSNYFLNTGAAIISTNSGMGSAPTQSRFRRNYARNVGTLSTPNVNAVQGQFLQSTIIEYNDIANVYTSVPDGDILEIDWAWVDTADNHNSQNVIIRYNTLSGANSGVVSSCIQVYAGVNTTVYGNTCTDASAGISNTRGHSTGNVYYNNTIYGTTTACANLDDGATGSPSPATTWYNNIMSTCGTNGIRIANGSTAPTETNNVYWGNATIIRDITTPQTISINSTSVYGNPLFVDPENADFRLRRGSAAIGVGKWPSYDLQYLSDMTGFRTSNPTPDAGALFYQPGLLNF